MTVWDVLCFKWPVCGSFAPVRLPACLESNDVINAAVRCGDQVRATHSRLPTTHALVQDAGPTGGVHV
jgi:hypothetical protein